MGDKSIMKSGCCSPPNRTKPVKSSSFLTSLAAATPLALLPLYGPAVPPAPFAVFDAFVLGSAATTVLGWPEAAKPPDAPLCCNMSTVI